MEGLDAMETQPLANAIGEPEPKAGTPFVVPNLPNLPNQPNLPYVPSGSRRRKVDRSCVLCHRRKVRCDKKMPCSTCTRTAVLCCYPSGENPGPRQPKTTISAIATRLVQLERTLTAISSDLVPAHGDHQDRLSRAETPVSGSTPVNDGDDEREDYSPLATEEILVRDGHSSRYINEVLFSRVLEEEHEIRSLLATPAPRLPEADSVFLMFGTSGGEQQDLHPQKLQATQLWQVFTQNVDPVVKVLHIPTAQITVLTAIQSPDQTSAEVKALLFAIYFSAVTSLSAEESANLLGQDNLTSLGRFRRGFEQSLALANWLEHPTLTTLQSMVLYLKANRANNPGRSTWILSGLIIRAAQSIGIHRDGSNFKGMPPFEAEMRRRLWWQIYSLDSRAAEDHGFTIPSPEPFSTDTQPPLHVDDNALDPSMIELPAPVVGRWTEMTLTVACIDISRAMLRLGCMLPPPQSALSNASSTASSSPSPAHANLDLAALEARRADLVSRVQARVDALLQSCHTVVPRQRATVLVARLLSRKLALTARLQWLGAVTRGPLSLRQVGMSHGDLLGAVEVLELYAESHSDGLLAHWGWSADVYPQFHALTHALWYLRARPRGGGDPEDAVLVDRAWMAIDRAFQLAEKGRLRRGHGRGPLGGKWEILRALREKAVRGREAAAKTNVAKGDVSDQDTPSGREPAVPRPAMDRAPQPGTDQLDFDMTPPFGPFVDNGAMAWDAGFYDWEDMVEDMSTPSYEAPGS